jgi:hypothetical protein
VNDIIIGKIPERIEIVHVVHYKRIMLVMFWAFILILMLRILI